MRIAFTVLLGPIFDSDLSKLFAAIENVAPLIEVKRIQKTNSGESLATKTGITRHTVTEDDVEKMLQGRANGLSVKQIAAEIPCSEITVRRHAPD